MANLLFKLEESELYFPFVHLVTKYDYNDDVIMNCYEDLTEGKIYRFNVWIISEIYDEADIDELLIDLDVLHEIQNETLQLSAPGKIGTRPNPTASEFVFVTFRESGETVKLQRCYG